MQISREAIYTHPYSSNLPQELRQQHQASPILKYAVKIDESCSVYVEESGNPKGMPVVFVHGGPGATFKATDHLWFDPKKYRIIVYQQRGTHKCTPSAGDFNVHASIFKDVGIAKLADDMHKLREKLGVDKWLVFGGSWGSTLGLYYAEKFPQSCSGLVIRGIFLATEKEMEDFFTFEKIDAKVKGWNQAALKRLYAYAATNNLPSTPKTICANYRKLIVENNDSTAARLWTAFENYMEDVSNAEHLARILDDGFTTTPIERTKGVWETQLFDHMLRQINLFDEPSMAQLSAIPIKVVQGGQDPICPPDVAAGLVEKLRRLSCDVSFSLIPEGEHSPYSHPGMIDALVEATDQFALTQTFSSP